MKRPDHVSKLAAQSSVLDAHEIAERKNFLEFTQADSDRLGSLHNQLEPVGYAFAESFYAHLLEFAPLRHLLPDEHSLDRLRRSQSEYFSRLTAGDYGDDYVLNRQLVGQVHHRIGLEPKWYIGAYRKYLSGLIPLVWERCEGDQQRFLETYDSLMKIVLFDMGLALDSYFQADMQALQELKDYADRVICTMPSGLLVLDAQLRLRTINLAARASLGLGETEPVIGCELNQLLANEALAMLADEVLDKAQSARSLVLGPLPELGDRILVLTLSATMIDEAPALIIQLQDDTDSIKAEQVLERFRAALDATADAIYLIDRASMRFVDMNESACSVLGYTHEELLGMGPHQIRPGFSREELIQQFDALLASPARAGHIETSHQRKDGSTFPVEIMLRGFTTGGHSMLVAVARDISARKRTEEALRESEERFRATFRQAAVGIAHLTPDGRWLRVNKKLCDILGYTQDELLGLHFQDVTHPEDLARNLDLQQQLLDGKIENYLLEKRFVQKGGSVAWVALTQSLVRTSAGDPKYFISVIEDISARKRTEASLLLAQRALESSGNGIIITGCQLSDNPIVYVNPAFERITGYSEAEVLGRNCRFLHGDDHDQPGLLVLRQSIEAYGEARVTLRNYRKDGKLFWNELFVAPVHDESGMITHFVGVQNDISDQKRAEENLLHMATHDALTGLPNRSLLQDRISQSISHAERMQREVAVLFLDFDRFKNINDSLGHAAGDALISSMARRLRNAVRMVDTVARVGGDEFVIVLTDITRKSDITQVLSNLIEAIMQPVLVEGHDLSITASIGISTYPHDGRDVSSLLKNADTAMYRAKEAGRNGFRFYAQEMNADAVDRLRLENDLRSAIKKGDELTLHYQPQVDTVTGCIVAAEALLRWHHPKHGLISPVDFIPMAEETGLIVQIGEWVLRHVCAQLRSWIEAGHPGIVIAVNLSPRQFHQPDIVEMIARALSDYDLPPHLLELEITESSLMRNPEEAAILLGELSEMGFRLSVDDFGTGYSSLGYLKRFPLDALKIDRSFVADIESDHDSASIAAAVIALAHSLGLKVVAEGVELDSQMEYLRSLKCDLAQGYLLGRPMPADDLVAFMEKRPCQLHPTSLLTAP
jgi:diguanylate cyclase (GGDEF)-like protein/PAS domain S-box-containing protein